MKYLRKFELYEISEISNEDCLNLREYFIDFEDELDADIRPMRHHDGRGEFVSIFIDIPKNKIDPIVLTKKFLNSVNMVNKIGEFKTRSIKYLEDLITGKIENSPEIYYGVGLIGDYYTSRSTTLFFIEDELLNKETMFYSYMNDLDSQRWSSTIYRNLNLDQFRIVSLVAHFTKN